MLNKLKNKFILVNMIMVGGLIILIILGISALSLYQAIQDNTSLLSGAVNLEKTEPGADYVLVHATKSSIKVLENSILNEQVGEREIAFYVTEILNQDENTGWLLRRGILYEKRETSDGAYVAFTTSSVIISPVEDVFLNASSVGAAALFLLFLLSRKLAKTVIAPTEKAWDNQKRFIADASHDLKTPLTVIMANNEILMSHPEKSVDEQMKWLESTRDEGEYMTSLINKMLELAKTDNLLEKIKLDDINVSEITEKAVLQLEPLAFENGVEIVSSIEKDIVLSSSSDEFYKLTQILIDNAVKYAPKNSCVFVMLSSTKKEVSLVVNNRGEVIPPEQLEHIFDRFYRSDGSRAKGGFGLGLSIAKNVATALGGEIFAQSDIQNGTTFTVKFKL